jgi:hypothetical protein
MTARILREPGRASSRHCNAGTSQVTQVARSKGKLPSVFSTSVLVAGQYATYFNKARPHQGIGQRIPDGPANDNDVGDGNVIATSVLGGLHHDYRRAR